MAQRGPQQANAEYPVSLTFSNDGSFVTYPTLRCSGRLVPAGDVDGTRVYRQTITSGGCDQGGSWHVTREGADAVSAEYRSVRGSFTIEGQLAR
ncbi:hypothetical protein [Corynebacterium sp.]|uniref:hypothetical protein n=1 Tax=Corynebacterium sp. TaxID=1720 RepID=UPI0026E0EBAC|nr:hypothetical protein [Corynebacterium sp.]MDO5513280.1 hypothetical protein [Corynebacterium sp.]